MNTNYLILFKNPRDNNQINVLARQMYPGSTKYFMGCFKNATKKPYGYHLVDYKAKTPDAYRLRTDFLSEYPAVYSEMSRKKV